MEKNLAIDQELGIEVAALASAGLAMWTTDKIADAVFDTLDLTGPSGKVAKLGWKVGTLVVKAAVTGIVGDYIKKSVEELGEGCCGIYNAVKGVNTIQKGNAINEFA